MRYLLDTNVFVWWLNGDARLKLSIQKILENPEHQIFVSMASGWEMSIKHKIGKLPLKTTLRVCFEVSPFELLQIHLNHILQLEKLPFHHSDPFDRLLISQAKAENLTFITSDRKIWEYKTQLLKA